MNRRTSVACVVAKSFFLSEYCVKLSSGDAYIVDRKNVTVQGEPKGRNDVVNGRVLAYVVDERPLELLVELPGAPVAGRLRSWIPRHEVDVFPRQQPAPALM